MNPTMQPGYFLPYQTAWLTDTASLRLIQKSRQIGISYADAYDSVKKAATHGARLDVWISSRDEMQAKLYLEDCLAWAKILHQAAGLQGQVVIDRTANTSAYVLSFASGRCIYSLSSNPNALAGKRGHVKLDEFALHQDQRLLYRVAKPVTQWGGTLSIISTHRGANTLFNQLVRDITQNGNPMGWSLHSVPIQAAVNQGLVERINRKTGRSETREQFLKRLRAECVDEEQWLQEYCCVPADETTAFITYEMLTACEAPHCLQDLETLTRGANPLFLGVDVARKTDLCVLDLGECIGGVMWDRLRLELRNQPFARIKAELDRLLRLLALKRCCIDATGLGLQLAEEARTTHGWKVQPVTFTAPLKEQLAFALRADFEDRKLRIEPDPLLRADLRGLKKEVSATGTIRFVGDGDDSHCDRTWAKALRQHAARFPTRMWAAVA